MRKAGVLTRLGTVGQIVSDGGQRFGVKRGIQRHHYELGLAPMSLSSRCPCTALSSTCSSFSSEIHRGVS